MSQLKFFCLITVLLAIMLYLGLAFDNQALAWGSAQQDSPLAVRLNLPLVLRGYNYLEPTGILDPTFDDDGVVFTDLGFLGEDKTIYDLVVQPDGKIVAGGYTWDGTEYQFALARFEPDGSTADKPLYVRG